MIATALALNPYEIISNTLTNIVRWVLHQLGVEGIAATAVIVALAWLWWGYKLNALAGAGRSVAATIAQHAVVSAAVAIAVLLGLLYAGVIPGVDMQAAGALVSGAVDMLPLLVSGDALAGPAVAFWEAVGQLSKAVFGGAVEILDAGAAVSAEAVRSW
jgi:hypothetical protein